MNRELFQVFETSKNNIELINNTIDVIKEQKELKSNIKPIISKSNFQYNAKNNVIASYSHDSNEIKVYIENFAFEIEKLKRELKELNIANEINNATKLIIMQTILHELEHVYQYEISLDKKDKSGYAILSRNILKKEKTIEEIEKLLYEYINFIEHNINDERKILRQQQLVTKKMQDLLKNEPLNHNFYIENHDLVPIERIAEISSYRIIKDFLKNTNYQNLYHYFNSKKIYIELKGYKDNQCPLLNYIIGIGNASLLDELSLVFNKEMTIDEKLFYGLELTNQELKGRKNQIIKSLSKIK